MTIIFRLLLIHKRCLVFEMTLNFRETSPFTPLDMGGVPHRVTCTPKYFENSMHSRTFPFAREGCNDVTYYANVCEGDYLAITINLNQSKDNVECVYKLIYACSE